ncbi:MAG: tRNA (adenosine(37)-N6)-threonylcarbamoyltransferase complex dimerization subunit type 1 TsaB [Spirochaetes bacterium]|nr:MAG: tRNA (adenosine(37)-N6)-threonylcarbamoyltransferase complex dimerization subunit type 1 TsaB [Spirochaetota bacterium]
MRGELQLNTLVIDTSTSMELIAARKGERVSDMTTPAERSHSATLFDLVRRALEAVGLDVREIELIGVGIGPGSFTGIRISVSAARTLAQVLGVPLVGVPSALLYAVSCGAQEGRHVLVAFDAKKDRVFGALYEAAGPGGIPRTLMEPGDYEIGHLASGARPDALCLGDGALRYREHLTHALPAHVMIESSRPSGADALDLVEALYRARPDEYRGYEHVLPLYARRSDAEIILEKKKSGGA